MIEFKKHPVNRSFGSVYGVHFIQKISRKTIDIITRKSHAKTTCTRII